MIRRFFRHIKEGFIGIGRHFSMALSSIASVTITLLLIGLFLVLVANLAELTKEIESTISLSALVSYKVESKTELNSIKTQIEKIEGVKDVKYQSKDDEFVYYISQYPDLVDFYELYREDNPFHDAFIISLDTGDVVESMRNSVEKIAGVKVDNVIQNVKASVEKINGIDSVHDGGTNTYVLVDVLEKVRIFGGALVVGLAVLAIYLIYNTIHITIEARETEIWIMRNVGAKNGYIRAPFLVEGILIGIFGSLIPVAIIVFGYCYIYGYYNGVILGVFKLLPPHPYIFYAAAVLAGIGVVVGFIGSYLSVTRSLRRTR